MSKCDTELGRKPFSSTLPGTQHCSENPASTSFGGQYDHWILLTGPGSTAPSPDRRLRAWWAKRKESQKWGGRGGDCVCLMLTAADSPACGHVQGRLSGQDRTGTERPMYGNQTGPA